MLFSGTARWQSRLHPGISGVPQRSTGSVLLRRVGAPRTRVAAGKPLQVSFDAPSSGSGRVGGAEIDAGVTPSAPPLLLPEHSTRTSAMAPSTTGSRSSSEQRQRVLSDVKSFLADELEGVWATGVRLPIQCICLRLGFTLL